MKPAEKLKSLSIQMTVTPFDTAIVKDLYIMTTLSLHGIKPISHKKVGTFISCEYNVDKKFYRVARRFLNGKLRVCPQKFMQKRQLIKEYNKTLTAK